MTASEQDTVIQFSRDSETATIWTSDRTVMTKLDKLVKDGKNKLWRLKEENYLQDGEEKQLIAERLLKSRKKDAD